MRGWRVGPSPRRQDGAPRAPWRPGELRSCCSQSAELSPVGPPYLDFLEGPVSSPLVIRRGVAPLGWGPHPLDQNRGAQPMHSLSHRTFQALLGQACPGRRKAKNHQARNPVATGSSLPHPSALAPAPYHFPSFLLFPVTLSLLRRRGSVSCLTPVRLRVGHHQCVFI